MQDLVQQLCWQSGALAQRLQQQCRALHARCWQQQARRHTHMYPEYQMCSALLHRTPLLQIRRQRQDPAQQKLMFKMCAALLVVHAGQAVGKESDRRPQQHHAHCRGALQTDAGVAPMTWCLWHARWCWAGGPGTYAGSCQMMPLHMSPITSCIPTIAA